MPTKQWHFSEIKRIIPIADNKISRWLKTFNNQKLIKKIKNKNKMPYYISSYENPEYQNKKRIHAMKTFHKTGFLNHLSSLKDAKTVIIFGSYSRWDWHKDSDIDIFIYGDDQGLKLKEYSGILKKEIQLFTCKNKGEVQKLSGELLKNIIKGEIIKGDIDFIEVKASA